MTFLTRAGAQRLAGILTDRTRPAAIASLGVAIALAVQGVGFAFFSSPNVTMVMNAVPPIAPASRRRSQSA